MGKWMIGSCLVAVLSGCSHTSQQTVSASGLEINDVHSQLNLTKHAAVRKPHSIEEIHAAVKEAQQLQNQSASAEAAIPWGASSLGRTRCI